jgi:hypothetical protein
MCRGAPLRMEGCRDRVVGEGGLELRLASYQWVPPGVVLSVLTGDPGGAAAMSVSSCAVPWWGVCDHSVTRRAARRGAHQGHGPRRPLRTGEVGRLITRLRFAWYPFRAAVSRQAPWSTRSTAARSALCGRTGPSGGYAPEPWHPHSLSRAQATGFSRVRAR